MLSYIFSVLNMSVEIIFLIAILVMSVVIHEVSHGVVANWLGDPTARLQGRLTLNPVSHIDPMGSLILPGILALSGSPLLFGWAKPVPYNPYNFQRGGKWAEALVAGAGPASNLLIALIFGMAFRFGLVPMEAMELGLYLVSINVLLAIFNMIPIPPLDGSKVLASLLPYPLSLSYDKFRTWLEWNPFLGFGIVLVGVLVFGNVLSAIVLSIVRIIIG